MESADPTGPLTSDRRGRFYTSTSVPGEFAVWNPDGSWLTNVGREGRGPGEFEGRPSVWIDAWDTIHVRDDRSSWTILTPGAEAVRRMETGILIFRPFATVLEDVAVVAFPRGRDHVFDILDRRTGDVLRQFGRPAPSEQRIRRVMASEGDSTFWAAPQHQYRLERWSIDGRVLDVIEPESSWLTGRTDDAFWDGKGSPPPILTEIHVEEQENLLWVRLMIPDPDAVEDRARPGAGDLNSIDESYDFVIEAFDRESGEVLASSRADTQSASVTGFLPDGRAYRILEGRFGLRRYEILDLRLTELQ